MKTTVQQQKQIKKIMKLQLASNLSVPKFCKKHKIKVGFFLYWNRKFSESSEPRINSTLTKSRPGFLPVTIAPSPSYSSNGNIEVHYPSGIIVKFPTTFDMVKLNQFTKVNGGDLC